MRWFILAAMLAVGCEKSSEVGGPKPPAASPVAAASESTPKPDEPTNRIPTRADVNEKLRSLPNEFIAEDDALQRIGVTPDQREPDKHVPDLSETWRIPCRDGYLFVDFTKEDDGRIRVERPSIRFE